MNLHIPITTEQATSSPQGLVGPVVKGLRAFVLGVLLSTAHAEESSATSGVFVLDTRKPEKVVEDGMRFLTTRSKDITSFAEFVELVSQVRKLSPSFVNIFSKISPEDEVSFFFKPGMEMKGHIETLTMESEIIKKIREDGLRSLENVRQLFRENFARMYNEMPDQSATGRDELVKNLLKKYIQDAKMFPAGSQADIEGSNIDPKTGELEYKIRWDIGGVYLYEKNIRSGLFFTE